MWDPSGRQTFTYDKVGRLSGEERTLDGKTYAVSSSFDALDRPYQVTLPDGEVVAYSFGASGLLSQLTGTKDSVTTSYVSGIDYNALGQPTRYVLGDSPGSPVQRSYYGPDVSGHPYGALRSVRWPESGTALVDRTMSYDPVGNVTQIADAVNGETIDYSYDELDRLTQAGQSGQALYETYSYNEVGNLLSKSGSNLSYGDSAHVHAVTSFGGTSYGYDANGCMTTRGTQAIRYDGERRPVKVEGTGSATLWRAAYDGDGARRKRLDSAGTIHYLGSYERNVGTGIDTTETVTKYYHALGRLIAFRKNGVLYWVGTDHLGGTIRVPTPASTQ